MRDFEKKEQPKVLERNLNETEKPEKEERVKAVVERIERQLELGEAKERVLNCLDSKMDQGPVYEEDFLLVASALEGRGWQKIFTELETGDSIMSIATPTLTGELGVKNLNQLLGEQETDDVIHKRLNNATISRIENKGLGKYLDLGFKVKMFKIFDHVSLKELDQVVDEVRVEMQEEIKRKLELKLLDLSETDQGLVNKRKVLLKSLKDGEKSYQLLFSKRKVGEKIEEKGYSHIYLAVVESLQAIALLNKEKNGEIKNGGEYDFSLVEDAIQRIQGLQEELERRQIIYGNMEGSREDCFQIFAQDGVVEKELLQAIRKNSFTVLPGDEVSKNTFSLLQEYKSLLNCVDNTNFFLYIFRNCRQCSGCIR